MRRAMLSLALVASLVLSPAAFAGDRGPSTARALDQGLDRIAMARGAPPGLLVVVQRGRDREVRRRGLGDLAARRAPSLSDHYRIASMAKAYSGAVALALVRQGRLSLTDTIGQRLPGVLPLADQVTLAQVLHHTGGLPDYIRQQSFIDRFTRDPGAYMSPQDLVGFVRDVPLRFRPGARYEYSDTDNVVVGLMAEAVTGQSYEQLLSRYVYQPLGVRRTSLPRTVRMPRPFLHGYELEPGKRPEDVSQLINPSGAWASGGIVSTAPDVGSFFRGLLGAACSVPPSAGPSIASGRGPPRPRVPARTPRAWGSSATGRGAAPSSATPGPSRVTGCSPRAAPTGAARSSSPPTRRSCRARALPSPRSQGSSGGPRSSPCATRSAAALADGPGQLGQAAVGRTGLTG
jgi:D-alanyl-D-alanine carboxypeptidase